MPWRQRGQIRRGAAISPLPNGEMIARNDDDDDDDGDGDDDACVRNSVTEKKGKINPARRRQSVGNLGEVGLHPFPPLACVVALFVSLAAELMRQ